MSELTQILEQVKKKIKLTDKEELQYKFMTDKYIENSIYFFYDDNTEKEFLIDAKTKEKIVSINNWSFNFLSEWFKKHKIEYIITYDNIGGKKRLWTTADWLGYVDEIAKEREASRAKKNRAKIKLQIYYNRRQ